MIEQIERFGIGKSLVGFGAGLGLLQTEQTSPMKLAYVVDGAHRVWPGVRSQGFRFAVQIAWPLSAMKWLSSSMRDSPRSCGDIPAALGSPGTV